MGLEGLRWTSRRNRHARGLGEFGLKKTVRVPSAQAMRIW